MSCFRFPHGNAAAPAVFRGPKISPSGTTSVMIVVDDVGPFCRFQEAGGIYFTRYSSLLVSNNSYSISISLKIDL